MTAEIAIMNKEAVALAADSAATITVQGGQKIFTSANKIFALSKYQPVGIMIYGAADFLGLPWETLVKLYRRRLNDKSFPALIDYLVDFRQFLDDQYTRLAADEREEAFWRILHSAFRLVRDRIRRSVEGQLADGKRLSLAQLQRLVDQAVKEAFDELCATAIQTSVDTEVAEQLVASDAERIDSLVAAVFENLPVTPQTQQLLKKIAVETLSNSHVSIHYSLSSGVVVAGFGENDLLPYLTSIEVEGFVGPKLKYFVTNECSAGTVVAPFAQSEMVYRFIMGIDPEYQAEVEREFRDIFAVLPSYLVDNIGSLSQEAKDDLKRRLDGVRLDSLCAECINRLTKHRETHYIESIMTVVHVLPKDQLAELAESLVNLTAIKRRVSLQSETVGGPIDVALISKGDGFIWIKRKHYFKPELNPRFFDNYYREVHDAQEDE